MIPSPRVNSPEVEYLGTSGTPVVHYLGEEGLLTHLSKDAPYQWIGSSIALTSHNANVTQSPPMENEPLTLVPMWAKVSTPDEPNIGTLSPPQETIARAERLQRIAKVDATLRGFSKLPKGWDSYGGLAISLDAIDEARTILRTAISLDLPEPWVAPGGDAGIGIQWDTDRASMYIDVVPDEETTYVLTPKAAIVSEVDGVLTRENLLSVLSQLADQAV